MENANYTTLTFGNALTLLFTLCNGQLGSREDLFAFLFKSYHDRRTEELGDCSFRTSPSQISLICKNVKPLPRKFLFHYGHDDGSTLRCDLECFFNQATQTAKQKDLYITSLQAAVCNSKNLFPSDKDYILSAANSNDNAALEIWFRAFFVLMREPMVVTLAG